MKLRQKLAAVLAATMVVTAVPVVTMASSDNKLTNSVKYVDKDKGVQNYGYVKIELEDNVDTTTTNGAYTIYLNLEGAEWARTVKEGTSAGGDLDIYDMAALNAAIKYDNQTGSTNAHITATRNGDDELAVKFEQGYVFADEKVVYIPLYVEVTDDEASITVDGDRGVISTTKKMVFAQAQEDEATVKFEEAEKINEDGVVADITVEEPYPGVIGQTDVTYELKNSDYKFDKSEIENNAAKYFERTRGFSGFSIGTANTNNIEVNVTDDKITLTFHKDSTSTGGRVKAVGLPIIFDEDDQKTDDEIDITVDGKNVKKTRATVATVKDFNVEIEMKDKKVVDVTAGTTEDITFTVKEDLKDSISNDRTVEVRLEKGYFLPKERDSKDKTKYEDGTTIPTLSLSTSRKDGSGSITAKDWIWDDDDRAVGFKFEFTGTDGEDTEEFEFKDIPVYMPLGTEGQIKLTMDGRGISNKAEVVAVNAKAPVTVTAEPVVVKVGLKDQKGGKIVIKETEAGMLGQGDYLRIAIDGYKLGKDDKDIDGLRFNDDPIFKVTEGDIELDTDNIEQKDGYVEIKIKRDSKKASTIEITELPLVANRSVPEGSYDLLINGAAVAPDCDLEDITAEKFFKINTPNTEDQGNGGLAKGTTSFVIGANKYVVNGVDKEMDAAAYVSKAGRTMVPVKYLADAFGVDAKNVVFSNGTVTIIAANRTVQIKNNSNVAVVNGVAMTMDEKMVIKNGRSYAPASQIGNLLGVTPKWDAATQTASFTN